MRFDSKGRAGASIEKIARVWRVLLSLGFWLSPMVALPELSAALAPSESKIGPHLHIRYTAGARQILQAGPRVIKILDTLPALMQATREYKAGTPGGLVVLRAYTTSGYGLAEDPAASARDFWNRVLGPSVNGLSASDRHLIDYMEGPNECDQTPCWGSVTEAR